MEELHEDPAGSLALGEDLNAEMGETSPPAPGALDADGDVAPEIMNASGVVV